MDPALKLKSLAPGISAVMQIEKKINVTKLFILILFSIEMVAHKI